MKIYKYSRKQIDDKLNERSWLDLSKKQLIDLLVVVQDMIVTLADKPKCKHKWVKQKQGIPFTHCCSVCGIYLTTCYQCGGDSTKCSCNPYTTPTQSFDNKLPEIERMVIFKVLTNSIQDQIVLVIDRLNEIISWANSVTKLLEERNGR